MELLGLLLWVLIGLLFGMMGAGGSILTLPVLVYLFRIDISTATIYSLFIVGAASLLGAFSYMRKGQFNRQAAIDFGLPSIIAVVITKIFIDPVIPDVFFTVDGMDFSKETFLMCLLAILMLISACRMIGLKNTDGKKEEKNPAGSPLKLTVTGIIVGVLSGLVGVGGGFLIIPALVVFCKLPIKEAVGTSLTIIAIQSMVGFLSGSYSYYIDWSEILPITLVVAVGVLLGTVLSKKVEAGKLKVGLGWLIGVTACCIIAQETVLKIM